MRAVDCVRSPISYSPSSILKCFTVLNTRLCAEFRDVSQCHSKPARVNVQWGRVRERAEGARGTPCEQGPGAGLRSAVHLARKRTIAPRTQMLRLASNSPASPFTHHKDHYAVGDLFNAVNVMLKKKF